MMKNLKMAALVLASVLVLAGCAKTESVESVSDEKVVETSVETSTETSAEASVETFTETSTEASVEASVETSTETSVEVLAAENNTLEDYLAAHPEEQANFRSQEAASEGLVIEVKENTLYFNYTLPFAVDDTTKDIYKETLESALIAEDSLRSVTAGIKLMETGYGIDDIILVYTYLDENGEVIYTGTFNDEGIVE